MDTPSSSARFVWHDCLTTDIDSALEFFSEITDWSVFDQVAPNVGRYPIIKSMDRAIAGILEMPQFLQLSGTPPYWTGYVDTNLEHAIEAIPRLGGQMFTMPTKSPMGTSLVFTDAGGAVLAAYQPSESFVIPSSSRTGEIVWHRLYSSDPNKSDSFYGTLFDWQISDTSESFPGVYDSSGLKIADIGEKPTWVDADTWVYFIAVEDCARAKQTIVDLGGVVIANTEVLGLPAVVAKDAQGGVIGFVDA